MEAMRDLLRGSLGRSLRDLGDEDRMAAAWTVACGPAMAERGAVVGYQEGVVRVQVADAVWLRQMNSLGGTLRREVARIAQLPVQRIDFELKTDNKRQRTGNREPQTANRKGTGGWRKTRQ